MDLHGVDDVEKVFGPSPSYKANRSHLVALGGALARTTQVTVPAAIKLAHHILCGGTPDSIRRDISKAHVVFGANPMGGDDSKKAEPKKADDAKKEDSKGPSAMEALSKVVDVWEKFKPKPVVVEAPPELTPAQKKERKAAQDAFDKIANESRIAFFKKQTADHAARVADIGRIQDALYTPEQKKARDDKLAYSRLRRDMQVAGIPWIEPADD